MYIDTVDACMHVHISICMYIIINKWLEGRVGGWMEGCMHGPCMHPSIGLHVVWMDVVELICILIQWMLVCMFILVFACI